MNDELIEEAFETLLEQVEIEANSLNDLGSLAFKKREYEIARKLADRAEKIASFRSKILTLSTEWNALARKDGEPKPALKARPTKGAGKLRKGMRTPEEAYYEPILRSLVEFGGSAEMSKVLNHVHRLISHTLKSVDLEPLPSGSPSSVRWRNTAQWARNTLKEHGYLSSDSPHGIREITDQGRARLSKADEQNRPFSL